MTLSTIPFVIGCMWQFRVLFIWFAAFICCFMKAGLRCSSGEIEVLLGEVAI